MDVNVDPRWDEGAPDMQDARRYGLKMVRLISLPENEHYAAECLVNGIQVLAIYTGESNNAGNYVMQQASAIQIGNEPQFAMNGAASWPTGTADDMVNVWNHVANVLVPQVHPKGIPLVGPGIWMQDHARWVMIADRLPGLSAAAVHVYNATERDVAYHLPRYRNVRPDLPLLCAEWTARGRDLLLVARAIDRYCARKIWYSWGPGVPGHALVGTPEFGVLALSA